MSHFCPPGSGYGSRGPFQSGSNPDPDPQHCLLSFLFPVFGFGSLQCCGFFSRWWRTVSGSLSLLWCKSPDPNFYIDADLNLELVPCQSYTNLWPLVCRLEPLRLHCELPQLLNFGFNADPDPSLDFDVNPDPTLHSDADPDPDPASQNDADPDPQHFSYPVTLRWCPHSIQMKMIHGCEDFYALSEGLQLPWSKYRKLRFKTLIFCYNISQFWMLNVCFGALQWNSIFSDLLQPSPLTWHSSKVCCTGCQGTRARLVSIPFSPLMDSQDKYLRIRPMADRLKIELLFDIECYTCSTTGKPTHLFRTKCASLDSV